MPVAPSCCSSITCAAEWLFSETGSVRGERNKKQKQKTIVIGSFRFANRNDITGLSVGKPSTNLHQTKPRSVPIPDRKPFAFPHSGKQAACTSVTQFYPRTHRQPESGHDCRRDALRNQMLIADAHFEHLLKLHCIFHSSARSTAKSFNGLTGNTTMSFRSS